MFPSPLKKPKFELKANSLRKPKPPAAIPSPDPENPFPKLAVLPEIESEPEKKPEESGVKLKAPIWEEEAMKEKFAKVREAMDYLGRFLEEDKAREGELDVEIKWEVIEKMLVLANFAAEYEYPNDMAKKAAREAELMELYVPAQKPINPEFIKMFRNKTKIFLDKIKDDAKRAAEDEAAA